MTDEATQIELNEELSKQLEAVRGLMTFRNAGEVPSDQDVIECVIAFYLDEHDVVRNDDSGEPGISVPQPVDSLSSPPTGRLPETDLDLGTPPREFGRFDGGEE